MLVLLAPAQPSFARETVAVTQSTLSAGFPASGATAVAISADGRYVLFGSKAPNLVGGQTDTNNAEDVFLFDRVAGASILVSHSANSPTASGSGASHPVGLSPDGRFVLYQSLSTNLVVNVADTNGRMDVFLWDRQAGESRLVSRAASGATTAGNGASFAKAVTADGRFVLFDSAAADLVAGIADTGQRNDVFVFDAVAGSVELQTPSTSANPRTADGSSDGVGISDDGRFVLFSSTADDLVPGVTDSNWTSDVFLRDRTDGSVRLVSRAGAQVLEAADGESVATALTPDGRYTLFRSAADDVVSGVSDANFAAYDVFVFDRLSGAVDLITRSVAQSNSTADGWSTAIAMTPNGRYVLFQSNADDLSAGVTDLNATDDVFVFDRETASMILVSAADGAPMETGDWTSTADAISADGHRVLFDSVATDLTQTQVPWGSPARVYVRDLQQVTTTLVARSEDYVLDDANSFGKAISAGGEAVLFSSRATDLLPTPIDANDSADAFVWDSATQSLQLVGSSLSDARVAEAGSACCVTADGAVVVFSSGGGHLAGGVRDENGAWDVFAQERGHPIEAVSVAAGGGRTGSAISLAKAITPDGRFVLFESQAEDLVPGFGGGGRTWHAFVFDRELRISELIDHTDSSPLMAANSDGIPVALSSDGRFVLFSSTATDLAPGIANYRSWQNLFVRDRATGALEWLTRPTTGPTVADANAEDMSPDGRFVVFSSTATNFVPGVETGGSGANVFLVDRASSTTTLVSHAAGAPLRPANGDSSRGRVTPDGRHVTFSSYAVDVVAPLSLQPTWSQQYLWDRDTGENTLVSHAASSAAIAGNGWSSRGLLTPDGRYVAYMCSSPNVVVEGMTAGPQVVLYDRTTNANTLLTHSAANTGLAAGGTSWVVAMSADARFVLFNSDAPDLAPPALDRNSTQDAFLLDRHSGITLLSQSSITSLAGSGSSQAVGMSADGSTVLFESGANDLVPGELDDVGTTDVFLSREPQSGAGFYTLQPCRLLDTRLEKKGSPLQAGETRSYSLLGGSCGVPTAATALSLNVTAVGASAGGNVQVFQEDVSGPPDTTSLALTAGRTRANNGVVRLSLDGFVALKVRNDSAAPVHVVIDVNGYFGLP